MKSLNLKNRTITTELPAFVMGIVNATPDSFFDKSRGGVDDALRLIDEGADLLDIGGESTRPGSEYVSAEEEIRRVIPVIEGVRKVSDIPISVDTRKFEVMKAAFEAGADILNDISALEDDERLAPFCAQVKIPVILMHKRGNPSTMQKNTVYENVFDEVNEYLEARVEFALAAGIEGGKIWLDPGIGFGKNMDDNFELIRRCGEFLEGKYPLLMALSRKTCIGQATGREVADRLSGTLAADLLSVERGASMIRVHDVKEHVDTLKILSQVSKK
ncbi:dihydropteroate synthase [Treponema ruminis]|uniref:dihydropteroate synthase n=1 Tax=Treponema ruminis TaxID=744515 RepID=A0A7W8LLX7_9SPIR|nr:dihydropteroate synthase [Treponema ruminis]MBB5225830.1 dihydropteroate synthase [Treponema ruminis]QSI02519.1 dihydropteroate synthase [Treponema ruminis]